MSALWDKCLDTLKSELDADDFNTWIKPLHSQQHNNTLMLLAPNKFVKDQIVKNHSQRIIELIAMLTSQSIMVDFEVGGRALNKELKKVSNSNTYNVVQRHNNLNKAFTFTNHVEGKSNQIARAAALQISENPGNNDYNPLFFYGGVGLGKTHLMQAAGNQIVANNKNAKVCYVHSERFVAEYVRHIQQGTMDKFKNFYRSLDALLIDDIQFFAEKKGSQEEFFHTFNALVELNSQLIITSDCIPKELGGVEERLISRFSMGLAVPIDPPEFETRVAILNKKAKQMDIELADQVAYFVAKQIRSNVRELEGALNRINADAKFAGRTIDVDMARNALKDILVFQEKMVTIQNIQKSVAEYFKIRIADLSAKKRNQPIARARQIAMRLSKELTNSSLPEIGEEFGGRDHTTVLHACRKIDELRKTDAKVSEDYDNLINLLSG